jgi:hypothetical protein
MYSNSHILGIHVDDIYREIQALLHTPGVTQFAFADSVANIDRVGTASKLLSAPHVVDALWTDGNLSELWSSEARGALETVDEMTVFSLNAGSTTLAPSEPPVVLVARAPLQSSVLPSDAATRRAIWPARPRLRGISGALATFGVSLCLIGLLPMVLQAAGSPAIGRGRGQVPQTSLLPLIPMGSALTLLLVRPSDRSLATLYKLVACEFVTWTACMTMSAKTIVSNWPPTSLFKSQAIEAAILTLVASLNALHIAYVGISHVRKAGGNGRVQMHEALHERWAGLRLAILLAGCNFVVFATCRMTILHQLGRALDSRGYYIDLCVGVFNLPPSHPVGPHLHTPWDPTGASASSICSSLHSSRRDAGCNCSWVSSRWAPHSARRRAASAMRTRARGAPRARAQTASSLSCETFLCRAARSDRPRWGTPTLRRNSPRGSA